MNDQSGERPIDTAADFKRDRLIIVASSLGTVFEWYDFFLYGILAALIGRLFFPIDNPTAATLASLATFGAGFGVRPIGAMLFGHYGDRIGRKYTFLITITLMGAATALIGFLPTYAQAGLWAPALLVGLRLLQGLALGGEYGGAAIYVGEHAPKNRRGEYTSWIQISVAGGFLLCLIVVLTTRSLMTTEQFDQWGWRIPFLLSLVMLAISVYIRMQLSESPVFKEMKEAGKTSKNPIVEAFSDKSNIGNILVALFGVSAGLTVVYYTSQFGTLYFLTGTAGVSEKETLIYLALGAIFAAPFYVLFGMLSDRIGRKKLLLIGYALSILLIFPLFHLMANGANPALARATAANPVTLELPECEFRIFARTQTEECAKALGFLTKRGIAYERQTAESVTLVVGDTRVEGFNEDAFAAALKSAGYPEKADPAEKQRWKIVFAVFAIITLSAMTYGQVAAILVELFPAKVRYTSMSIPYHIGTGYFGGFLPFIQQLIVVRTGDPFAGLWYTIGVVAMAFIVSAIWLPETRHRDIRA
ncbi:MFS transporter [Sandaracinobacteroides hominis]|uniref:MFS transporter n=1 Tax=Sandaracinobacteroides hominis TaxID=2780086 RepID=UPI0018F64ADD|nr:MFS transporter [Sandaracinobacteroides hominis]